MSRRAKILITALFLVPLFFLAAYVVITWAPREPLQFHAVVVEGYADAPPGWRVLEFVVENTSYAPIRLVEFHQAPADHTKLPSFRGAVWTPSLVTRVPEQSQPNYIPAHSRVRTWRIIHEHDLQKYQGASWMQCIWISETRERFCRGIFWLYKHGPAWLRPHLTPPPLNYDSTPITVPPGA